MTATPSFALFGVGDIVFDPTSYASLVSQLTTIESQYNMLKNNVEHFSIKQQWQTTLTALKNVNVANMFGETNGMTIALNSNSRSRVHHRLEVRNDPGQLQRHHLLPGANSGSPQMSQLAMIEMSDSISPDCITAVGAVSGRKDAERRREQQARRAAARRHERTNSEVEQLNLLNAAEAQKMSEMQTQGAIQACLASQMAVANMQHRNAAATDLNTAAFVQPQRATNNVSAANEGNTWQTYLP